MIGSKDKFQILKRAGLRLALFIIFAFLVPFLIFWGAIAINFSNLPSDALRQALACLFALSSFSMFLFVEDIKKALRILCYSSLVLMLWFLAISPSNDKEWLPDVQKLPTVTFEENKVQINNIRNFTYHSKNSFVEHYYDDSFDLDKLISTDLFISYWDGLQNIAHTFVSFRFSDGKVLCASVEVRREKGETYSTAKGFFKQFELIYVLGNENDIVKVRTNLRGEETFMYPMTLTPEQSHQFLISLLQGADSLRETPKFYNTIGQNCTTTLVNHLNDIDGVEIGFHQKLLMNGVSDHFAYQIGGIDNSIPFAVLKDCAFISEEAKKISPDQDFSQAIRKIVDQRIATEKQKRSITP